MNHIVQTRHVYYWMEIFSKEDLVPYRLLNARSFAYLEELLQRVWKEEGSPWQCPELRKTRGTMSYSLGSTFIYLLPKHYCKNVLLHEITHALGYKAHGPGFVSRYIELLVKYGGADRGKLVTFAHLMNVKTRRA